MKTKVTLGHFCIEVVFTRIVVILRHQFVVLTFGDPPKRDHKLVFLDLKYYSESLFRLFNVFHNESVKYFLYSLK